MCQIWGGVGWGVSCDFYHPSAMYLFASSPRLNYLAMFLLLQPITGAWTRDGGKMSACQEQKYLENQLCSGILNSGRKNSRYFILRTVNCMPFCQCNVALLQQVVVKRRSAGLNQSFTWGTISVPAKNAFMSRDPLSETSKIQKRWCHFRIFKFSCVNNGIVSSWTPSKVLKGYWCLCQRP